MNADDRPDRTVAPEQSWITPKVELRQTQHGTGTFASADVAEGETVEVWGEWWEGARTVEYTTEAARVREARAVGLLVMQWDEDLFSIETRGGDPGYFINHSCDSNLWFLDAFTLAARRRIAAGEEITLDYALYQADEGFEAEWACGCGVECCRGHVTGRDWRLPDVQARYAGHFPPLLNQRIARLRPTDERGSCPHNRR